MNLSILCKRWANEMWVVMQSASFRGAICVISSCHSTYFVVQSMADYTPICPKSYNSIGQDKSLYASSALDFISPLQNDMFAIIFKYPCHKIWLCRDWWLSLHANSGCSAVGSAHVWGARGRQFESGHPDDLQAKGLIFSPFRLVGGQEVGEKSVKFDF